MNPLRVAVRDFLREAGHQRSRQTDPRHVACLLHQLLPLAPVGLGIAAVQLKNRHMREFMAEDLFEYLLVRVK